MSAVLNQLDPRLRSYARALFEWATRQGLHPRVTSVYRTRALQGRLYRAWLRRGRTGIPAAPPGQSWHQYRWAFDMVTNDLARTGAVWKSWGGLWWASDPVHFEGPH